MYLFSHNLQTIFYSSPHPVKTYAEALQRIEALRLQEPPGMNPVGRLQLLTHGHMMPHAIIFVHGYTNCPQQFHELARRFHALGYNVLSAPLPHHGLADRLTKEHARLTAEELVQYAHEVVDIAQGLGQQVDIAGISAGGVIAAYAGQTRPDVHLATVLAPPFGLKQIPAGLTATFASLLLLLPNFFFWWDPRQRDTGGIAHAYPRFSTHALAQTLSLGQVVLAAARRQPPAARLLFITNASDPAVSPTLNAAIVKSWRQHGAALTTYEFPASLKLLHDFIEPANPKNPIEVVYPKLIELMIS